MPTRLLPGFTDPVFEAQSAFRHLLDAMSRPGRLVTIANEVLPPPGITPAAAAICLCLLDQSTSVWISPALRTGDVEAYLRFHTGCRMTTDANAAAFALMDVADAPEHVRNLNPGSPEYPDRSATAIIQAGALHNTGGVTLNGPGIQTTANLAVGGAGTEFWNDVRRNHLLFPLGIDFTFAAGNTIACLPRSTIVEV